MIDRFEGRHHFLSNFYLSPIVVDGITYQTNEHFFQAHKTADPHEATAIALANTPREAKYLGRQVTLRPDWEGVKLQVMRNAIEAKFPLVAGSLSDLLVSTNPHELIEGNPWGDTYWGVSDKTHKGLNWLGILLMARRAQCVAHGIDPRDSSDEEGKDWYE